MKRLSEHILSLLRLYDSVALPGVGVFYLQYHPAEIDFENLDFLPPHYEVSFKDTSIPHGSESELEDSLEILVEDKTLLDSYIRKERVAPEDAWKMLAADLSEFRNHLARGGSPILEEFGSFNPPLPKVSLNPIKLNGYQLEIGDEDNEEDSAAPVTIENGHSWKNPNYYYIPIHKKVAKIAACLLLVVAVGLAALIPMGPSGNSKATASILPIAVSEDEPCKAGKAPAALCDTMAADSTMEAMSPDTVTAPEEASAPVVETPEKNEARYFAVVAAFRTESEANKFIDSQKGDKSRFEIIKNSRYYMISASSTNDKETLETNMPLVRSEYPDAWIFSMK